MFDRVQRGSRGGQRAAKTVLAGLVALGSVAMGAGAAFGSTASLGTFKAQQIKGWGVYPSGYVGQYPVKLVDVPNATSLLFAIKFNYARIGVASDTGHTDGTLDSTRMSDMRTQISKAIAYTGNYYLVTWSPPGYMKLPEQTTLGHSSTGATEYLNSSYESAYVSYWIKILQDLKNNNIALPACISLQNESNFDAPSWEGCDYDINDTQRTLYRTLVKDMRSALNNNGFSNVGVLAPESENYNGALSILGSNLGQLGSDTTLKNAISGVCVHSYDQYGCASVKSGAATYGKDLWETEWSNAVWPESDGDETTQAVTMLRHIGGDLVDGGINYWFWWGGINNTTQTNTDNENLLWGNTGDTNWHLSKKYYVLKTLINNVRPGWSLKPFSSSDDADLKVSNSTDPNPHWVELYGFEDPNSTQNVVVAANGTTSAKTLTISGLKGSSAAVYTLDSTHNMDNTANPTITNGSATVTLPATGAIILVTNPMSSNQLNPSGWSMQGANTDIADGPNAWDNNTGTRWTTWADQTNGQYFAINLGSQQSFNKIVLNAGNGDYPRGYQVFVSNDGTNWGSAVATGSGSSQITTITFGEQTAQYVKIVQTGSATGAWWSIAEMQIYNIPLDSSGWSMQGAITDIADGPYAWDNNNSTRWTTWTDQTNGQYFAVNLGSQQSFRRIVLDAGNADYPRGYQVFVSNDGTNWGSAVATGSGSSQVTSITFSPQSAKYVKIVQTGSATGAWWSIVEMKIYN